jgi:hypothetical protein
MQSLIIPIWEDKGIIIGLFAYLTNNHDNLQNKTIIINNNIYGSIIKMFFTKLKFKKKPKKKYINKFFINIKSNALPHQDLYINNLNNFIEINNDKTRLLPWYDRDNPIVMFHYKKDGKHINMDNLKEDIIYFDNFIRYEKYNVPGMTKNKCIIDCWDTYYEVKILGKFVKLYVGYNVKSVNGTINKILLSPSCDIEKTAYIPFNNCPVSRPDNVREIIKYLPGETREVIKYVPSEPKEIIKEVIKYVPSEPKEIIKEVIKEVPKEVIKYVPSEPKEIIKEVIKEVPKEVIKYVPSKPKEIIKEVIKYVPSEPKEIIKEVIKEVPKEVIKYLPSEPKEIIKEVIKEVPKEVIKYLPSEPKEIIKEVIKEVPKEVIKYKTDPTIIKILTDKLAEVNTILDLNLEDINETK